jgi:hypothetical protein
MLLQGALDAVSAFGSAFLQLAWNIGTAIREGMDKISTFISELPGKAKQAGSNFIDGIKDWFSKLPGRVGQFLADAILKITTWMSDTKSKAETAGKDFLKGITDFVGQIPQKFKEVGTGILNWITKDLPKAITEFKNGAEKMGRGFANTLVGFAERGVNGVIQAINKIQFHFKGFSFDTPAGKVTIGNLDWNGMQMGYINLPEFRKGAWDTGRGGPAMLHPHETVLPQETAEALRDAFKGGKLGGQGVTVNGPLVNIESFTGSDADLDNLMIKMANRLRLAGARA